MSSHSSTLHVLDFDGVVCDGLDECLLTAWAAFNRLPIDNWTVDVLDEIPEPFKRRFRHARNFVRHDGHFLVPFVTNEEFQSAALFEARYLSIDAAMREGFREIFQAVRSHVRHFHHDDWIGLHRVYVPMLAAIGRMQSPYIVSGKDEESIIAILESNHIALPSGHIVGGQTSKLEALLKLKEQSVANCQLILFCDDNLANAIEGASVGIETVWARWGYHTADDLQEAERAHMRGIDLHDVEAFFAF